MNESFSVLKFNRYVIDTINFKLNSEYKENEEGIEVVFDFDSDFHIDIDNGTMKVELCASIFKNAVENAYPFEMSVKMIGYFSIEGDTSYLEKFKSNAVAILFPYLRSLISTYTVNANISPIILPAMNINAYLERKRLNNEK